MHKRTVLCSAYLLTKTCRGTNFSPIYRETSWCAVVWMRAWKKTPEEFTMGEKKITNSLAYSFAEPT